MKALNTPLLIVVLQAFPLQFLIVAVLICLALIFSIVLFLDQHEVILHRLHPVVAESIEPIFVQHYKFKNGNKNIGGDFVAIIRLIYNITDPDVL